MYYTIDYRLSNCKGLTIFSWDHSINDLFPKTEEFSFEMFLNKMKKHGMDYKGIAFNQKDTSDKQTYRYESVHGETLEITYSKCEVLSKDEVEKIKRSYND